MAIRLHQVQDEFQRYLLRGDTAIEDRVVGTTRVPIATRLAIYGGGYGARLSDALQANFPMLARLVGESDFEKLASDYIRGHDSTFASIRYYGDALPEFLEHDPAYASVPVLAEMARWEWAMTEVFDAADAVTAEPSAMAKVPPQDWAELRFQWHPSVRRVRLAWNVPQIWKLLASQPQPADAQSVRPEVTLADGAGQWLLWRCELEVFFRSLSGAEAVALDAALGGRSFGATCDALCESGDESVAPAQAAGFLREWLQSGLITRIAAAGS